MDFNVYIDNLIKIYEIDSRESSTDKSPEEFMLFLLENAREKRKLQKENNDIIAKYIKPYHQDLSKITPEALADLENFQKTLMSKDILMDVGLSQQISKILYHYYKSNGDLAEELNALNLYSYYEAVINNTRINVEIPEYKYDIRKHFARLDSLTPLQKNYVLRVCLRMNINWSKEYTGYMLQREYVDYVIEHEQELINDIGHAHLKSFYTNMLMFYFNISRRKHAIEIGEKFEHEDYEGFDDKKETYWVEHFLDRLRKYNLEENDEFLIKRDEAYCTIAEFHIGRITLEELLFKLESMMDEEFIQHLAKKEDEVSETKWNAFFYINGKLLSYLRYDGHNNPSNNEKAHKIIQRVFEEVDKNFNDYYDDHGFNLFYLSFDAEAFHYVDFSELTRAMKTTVFMDRSLYIHCIMVKNFAKVICSKMLDTKPEFFDGLMDKPGSYYSENKEDLLNIIENACDLHDTGKYFCLAFTSINHRDLTDYEFMIVQEHPTNFGYLSKNIQNMSDKTKCIVDCATLHHRWFNEQGGYPKRPHTKNKPMVSIISVADVMDAALDSVGRTYKKEKDIPEVMAELIADSGTRYDPEVIALLEDPALIAEVDRINTHLRAELNKTAWEYTHRNQL